MLNSTASRSPTASRLQPSTVANPWCSTSKLQGNEKGNQGRAQGTTTARPRVPGQALPPEKRHVPQGVRQRKISRNKIHRASFQQSNRGKFDPRVGRQCMYTLWLRGKGTGRRINSIMDRDNSSSPYRKTACGPAHRSPPASWQASPRSRHGPLPLAMLLLLPPPLTPVRRMDVEMSGCVCSRRRQGQGMRGPGRGAWGRRTLVLYMASLDDVSTTSEDVCVCVRTGILFDKTGYDGQEKARRRFP